MGVVKEVRPFAKKLATWMVGIQCALVGGGLLYRAIAYKSIPVAPGEPYGIGDVVEFLLYFTLIGSSVLTLLAAGVLSAAASLRNWPAIAALIWAGLLALPAYLLLHRYIF